MTSESRRWRSGVALALFVVAIVGCPGIREDELACEDAVSHLQACCPDFTAGNIDCSYVGGGSCDEIANVYPEIPTSQAACIRGESCDELRSTSVCARAAAAPNGATWAGAVYEDDGSTPYPQVCP